MRSLTGDQLAGLHILADFWGVERMGDLDLSERQLKKVYEGLVLPFSTLIIILLGTRWVSGVTVLSESNISIHMVRTQFCINRCFYAVSYTHLTLPTIYSV